MTDMRNQLEWEADRVDLTPGALDRVYQGHRRRERRRRLAAGLTGGVLTVAVAVWLAGSFNGPPPKRPAQTQLSRNGVIAFEGNRGLYLSDPDGTDLHLAVRNPAAPPEECGFDRDHYCTFRGAAWSPDGTQLAFVYGEPSVGLLGDMALYVMDANTEEVRLLTRCPARSGDDTGDCDNGRGALSWSPDGERIAFSSGFDLFLVDSSSGELSQITGCASCAYQGEARHPTWSPPGEGIAFSGPNSLEVVSADGATGQTIVDADEGFLDRPNGTPSKWSPDGTMLVFSHALGVSVVDADGSGLRLLVRQQRGEGPGAPSWSPDGERIVYISTPGSGPGHYRAEIRVVDLDGTGDRLLYRSKCCIQSWGAPMYSPDGSKIAFSLGVADGSDVFVMTTDGGDVHRLPGHGDLAWQALPR